ncbi:MAG TPA: hypothetical protein DCS97_00070 [Planctomycetes bacterium]|nr:hypothetical protein [Planctomycetota bacterium]
MAMFWALRTYAWFAFLVVGVCAAAAWLPSALNRVQAPQDYSDLSGIEGMEGYWLQPPPYLAGHLLAYRIGDGPDDIGFGRILAVPGDDLQVVAGHLQVGGAKLEGGAVAAILPNLPEIGPLRIPAGQFFVLSDGHGRDSIARGLIGPDVILGRVRE